MNIEVRQRRVVPDREGYGHRGQHAALAVTEDGYRSWGFGDTEVEADKDAIASVTKLKDKVTGIRIT